MADSGPRRPYRPVPPPPEAAAPPPARRRSFAATIEDGDTALLRVVGVIVVLAIVIAVLVLSPLSPLGDGGSSDGVTTRARADLPELPAGLVARSALYDLSVPDSVVGPVTMTVRIDETPTNVQNLALYSYDGGTWQRLGSAQLVGDGSAEGVVDHVPGTIAVVERTALAHQLAFIVGPEGAPDPAAGGDGIVAVPAAFPALDAEGQPTVLDVEGGSLGAAFASGHPVYLGVTVRDGEDASIVDAILGSPDLIDLEATRIAEAASSQGVAGVYLDYRGFDPAFGAEFSSLSKATADALAPSGIALAVAIEAPGDNGTAGFEWRELASSADSLWLHGPADGDEYYSTLEAALAAAEADGVDLSAVWLVFDRHSRESTPDGVQSISLREALTNATTLRTRLDVGIAPGDGVTLEGASLGEPGGYGWSDAARAVSYTYEARGGSRTVWIENRFSLAFRLDLAQRFGLGGVVVAGAEADETLPDVWNTVSTYVEEGRVRLELPYGPYLQPEWRTSGGTIEGAPTDSVVVWRAPTDPGVYDVTLLLSDGQVFVGQQLSLRVTEGGTREEPTPTETATATETTTAPGPAGN
ncbi:MAG: hypothetical protein R3C39_02015 [Dehalococcoidia bacterium]